MARSPRGLESGESPGQGTRPARQGATPQIEHPAESLAPAVAVAEARLIAWVPGRLRNPLNRGKGEHWAAAARERKGWRDRTYLCCTNAMTRAGLKWRAEWPKRIVLTAYVWNLYDEDGLAAATKSVVDGLKDARLIHEDGPKAGHHVERRQTIDRLHRGVEVVVQLRWGGA